MAKKTPAAPRFYEVVFQGKPKVVKAFIKGLMMGAGRDKEVFYSFDENVHHEGNTEKLKEMFGIRAIDCHVIVGSEGSSFLKQMARKISDETGLKITGNRYIRSASMLFEYHAYAPRYNSEIQLLLKSLPKGLKLVEFVQEVKRDPDAKGVEAYSVAHEYEASGSGTITGRIDLLIALRRKLSDFPLIDPAEIKLNMA